MNLQKIGHVILEQMPEILWLQQSVESLYSHEYDYANSQHNNH